jgi:hypothetical protein
MKSISLFHNKQNNASRLLKTIANSATINADCAIQPVSRAITE